MDHHGPFQIKKSLSSYKNPWLEVREDQVIRPDGSDGIFGVVTMRPGVSILPMDEEGNVYVIREYQYAIDAEKIMTASGGIHEEESPLDAAKRELLEETGIQAKEWVDLGEVHAFTMMIDSPAYLFLARDLTFSAAQPEDIEILTLIKMPFEKLYEMVMRSEIIHGPSTTLILKAKEYLKK